VPEEFADTYRQAYQRALESDVDAYEHLYADAVDAATQEAVPVGAHRSGADTAGPARVLSSWRSASWFMPLVLASGALVLVAGAYVIGSALSGDGAHTGGAKPGHDSGTIEPAPSTASGEPPTAEPSTSPGGWDGPVKPVAVDAISADCTAPPGRDSAGRKVTYVPENAIDGKVQTAWRCPGTAVGQKLTLRFAADADVAEVGLVPGYAKTDPESGIDRYAENNRITRVRWTLGDGTSVVQRLDPNPRSRALQVVRVPRTTSDVITLEILGVERGPRNTTAISEVAVSSAR
jgi:hypothetical protein